jgi:hypothetical protein
MREKHERITAIRKCSALSRRRALEQRVVADENGCSAVLAGYQTVTSMSRPRSGAATAKVRTPTSPAWAGVRDVPVKNSAEIRR